MRELEEEAGLLTLMKTLYDPLEGILKFTVLGGRKFTASSNLLDISVDIVHITENIFGNSHRDSFLYLQKA